MRAEKKASGSSPNPSPSSWPHDTRDGRRNKSKDIPLISMQEKKKKKKSKTRPLSDVGCGEPDSEQN